jgi:hypothetical protein
VTAACVRGYAARMAVSDRDRAYMQRIGEYKAASHDEARMLHLAATLSARLARSWQLYLEGRGTAAVERRDDDPSAFYERARALGLYLA